MSTLPLREPRAQTAEERARRAAWLRRVLGPVEGWHEDWVAEFKERSAIAEFDGWVEREVAERQALEEIRTELLGRLP